ncbi:MAG: peptidylprolyl isomerase [Candidatus Acidiferrales bacterium]
MILARRLAGILASAVLLSAAAGTLRGQTKTPAKKPATTTTARKPTMSYDPALLHPEKLTAKAPEEFEVNFSTTKGDFTVKVTRAWAPLGADRFYNLVKHHYFDNAAFFRVVSGFVVQFGLSAYPLVSHAWASANFKDDPVTQTNKVGSLTFATAGPNTRTTQLFINLGDNARLDSMGFSPFGYVASGMDVVTQLYSGYGESPDQSKISRSGKEYLDQSFPKLDSIKSTSLTVAGGPAPAHSTAAPKKP